MARTAATTTKARTTKATASKALGDMLDQDGMISRTGKVRQPPSAKRAAAKAPMNARQQAKALRDADRAAQDAKEQAQSPTRARAAAKAASTTAKANGTAKAGASKRTAAKALPHPDSAAYVAHVVTTAREAAGLSKAELAERMNTSAGAVARIEDARTNCTAATLANVAQALGLTLTIGFTKAR